MIIQTGGHDKYEGLHTPQADLITHASLTAPSTCHALHGRQPVRPCDSGRRSSVAVVVWAAVSHLFDARDGGSRVCEEEELDVERLVSG